MPTVMHLKETEEAKQLLVQLQNEKISFSQYLRALTDIQINKVRKGEL